MKKYSYLKWLLLPLLAGVLTGCQTSGDPDFDYVFTPFEDQPAMVEAPPASEAPAVEDVPDEPESRRGGIGRFFRRGGGEADAEEVDEAAQVDADNDGPPPVAQAPVSPPADPEQVENLTTQGYILRTGDPIIVILSGPTVDERVDANIDERGFIKLRHIGSVRAAGRTATQLEREIEAEYTDRQEIYREIYATIHIPNRFYFIGGEVRQPGRYPLVGRVTLSQAIVAAGNFTEWARNDGRLTLLRNNERTTILFRDITNDPTLDVELRTGDVLTVDRRGF